MVYEIICERGKVDRMRNVELLIPAGNLENLKVAVAYGADAVYVGGEAFSLRAKAANFSMEELKEGIEYAHAHNVKVYVTVNIIAHNEDMEQVKEYLLELGQLNPDGLIIADLGILVLAHNSAWFTFLISIASLNC